MKRILPIVFFLLYSCAEYNYEDCISGNCVNGLGSAQYEPKGDEPQYYRELAVTSGVYTGYFRDGLRHGSGDFVKPGYDGFTFNGEWEDDEPVGKGVYSSKSQPFCCPGKLSRQHDLSSFYKLRLLFQYSYCK